MELWERRRMLGQRVAGQRRLYLDLRFWNDLCDVEPGLSRDPQNVECLTVLRSAVGEDRRASFAPATKVSMTSDFFGTPSEPGKRFSSLELAATAFYDAAALARAMSRTTATGKEAGPGAVRLYGPAGDASGDAWVRYKWRVWWAPPAPWRDDLTWPNGQTTVIIVRTDAALAYVSMQRTLYTSERLAAAARERVLPPDGMQLPTVADRLAEFPLMGPRLPASEWQLATLGETEHIGRVARRVRATRRAGAVPAEELARSGYWPGIDEYECLVDDGLQILLRLTGMVDGVPVATVSADDVRVDAPLPVDTFAFAPPAGTRIAHVVAKK